MQDTKSTDGVSRRTLLKGAAGATATTILAGAADAAANGKPAAASERIIVDGLDAWPLSEKFLRLMEKGGVDCLHAGMALYGFGSVYGFAHDYPNRVTVAKTVAEVRQAKADGKIALVMGSQFARVFEDAAFRGLDYYLLGSIKQMVAAVREHKAQGLGIQGICYNVSNTFGGGCLEHSIPLTRAGRHLVEALHDNRIVLDIGGHTGEQTSLDAIEISKGVPVVCTHTNFAALNPNARAISDRLAEAIAKTGGVIGITAISAFHYRHADNVNERRRQATFEEHLDQYDYAKQLIGVDHVGLGPDFIDGWGVEDPADSLAFPPWTLAPGVQTTVEGFEDISKLPNLIRGLQKRGWTEAELDKLLGGNWLRVYEQVWGA